MSELPRFGSPRQALAYLYAHHRGPTLARPRYHDAPPETGRSHWDASAVGVLLYGLRELGNCGIAKGSALDLRLRAWATASHLPTCPGPPSVKKCDCGERTAEVLNAERRLRFAMRAARMLRERPRIPRVARYVEPDGAVSVRLLAEVAKTACAAVQEMPMVP